MSILNIPTGGYATLTALNSDFNTGVDGSTVSLNDTNGNVYNLGKIEDFDFRPKHENVTARPINYGGRELLQTERLGGTIEVTIARSDGTVEKIEYAMQQAKRNRQREPFFTATQFIQNSDGSSNELVYVNCRFRLTDGGQWKIGAAVLQKVELTFEDFYEV